ncbi:DUF3800 domain-containing protein [Herbivorax sp. ANBcel31]|uniref:DUF3800 domain-containing protein n=1 Tax=Herbivorax sp. ANBcel31 TaxID=3069754 RepID=UPI0027B53FF0|nr:DUF3800 domain-containing protein [Herbivorax sp. ANBcel31]MDQ2085170.1 DUF3800 domain-containing protein [Herbivorax sp. ANBcel31]
MISIFIDESEDSKRFAVGGIITGDKKALLDGIYRTRKYVKNKKGLTKSIRQKILNEMKDHFLQGICEDIRFVFIKNILHKKKKNKKHLAERESVRVFCAYYDKKFGEYFNQERKEKIYIKCIMAVLERLIDYKIDSEIELIYDIVYDEFGSNDFEKELNNIIRNKYINVKSISPGKSQEIKELQAADICIGCARRIINEENSEGFELIKEITNFIKVND